MAIIQKLYHKKRRKEKNIPHYLRSWAPLMFFTFSKETIRYKVPKAKVCHRQRCTLDVDNAVIGTISTTANSAILEVKHYRDWSYQWRAVRGRKVTSSQTDNKILRDPVASKAVHPGIPATLPERSVSSCVPKGPDSSLPSSLAEIYTRQYVTGKKD